MSQLNTKTIVFITGAFVSHHGWDSWKAFFESYGYTCYAPPWPYKDADAATLRARHPDEKVASITLSQLTDHYVNFVKGLPEKPIVIGHSMGGLIVQILLQRGLVAAGVGIHSLPPLGIFTFKLSFYRSTWGALGLFTNVNKSYLMTFKEWQYIFSNGMPLELQKAGYEANTIPESKRVSRGALTSAAKIDFKRPHAPLLLTSGSTDHILPASVNYDNYKAYKDKNSITDYKEFEGRNHFVLGQPTWQEDADFILKWIKTL